MQTRTAPRRARGVRLRLWGAVLIVLACATGGCASAPDAVATPAPLTALDPPAMVAAIRASAGDGDGELAVQPLRDPEVEDLRNAARRHEAAGGYAEAADALDAAIAIVAADPGLLQERAEVALLQRDWSGAAALAERAHGIGAQVGPLCRRHWATIEQVRLVQGDAGAAAGAKRRLEACRLAPPPRY